MAAEGADDNAQPQPADAVSATLGGLAGSNASHTSSGAGPSADSGGLGATVGAVARTVPQTVDHVAATATGVAPDATGGALPQTPSPRTPQAPGQPTADPAGPVDPVGQAVTDTVDHTVAHVRATKEAVTDDAGRTAAQVTHLATYAVQQATEHDGHVKHPASTDGAQLDAGTPQSDGPTSAPSDHRPPDTDGVATLSVPTLVSGVEDAANDLTAGVLHATSLDQTVQAPQVKVLSSALDDLGVSQALPSIPVPEVSLPLPTAPLTSAPVVGAPVGDVLGSLPVRTSGSLQVPGTLPPGGGPVTADPTGPTGPSGVTVPVPVGPAAPTTLAPGAPTTVGAIPALPVLLPFEAFPEIGTQGTQTDLTSFAGGDAKDPSVYLSRALLDVADGASDTGSIPVPTSPHVPAGHDAGPGAGQQDRAALTTFSLPGGRLTSPVREYSWHVPAAPISDPGFSPD